MQFKSMPYYGPPVRWGGNGGPTGGVRSIGAPRCMSLACEQNAGCRRDAYGNFPPDCATGARDPRDLGGDANPLPYGDDMGVPETMTGGQEPTASTDAPFNIGDIGALFGGMSTTTLLILGAVAYFVFFKKGR